MCSQPTGAVAPAESTCLALSCFRALRRDSPSVRLRSFAAVVHFAGRKAVYESVEQPMLYYTHNVVGAVNLIEAMRKHNVKRVR